MENTVLQTQSVTLTPEALLDHWQGHRRLTRRLIETFPEDKFFNYSVGGMRPCAALIREILSMTVPTLRGVIANKWEDLSEQDTANAKTKADFLRLWDEATEQINELWPQIPVGRFQETMTAFGQWEGPVHWILFYCIDNEIHHRAQAYVYLRSLGIEPPPFWER